MFPSDNHIPLNSAGTETRDARAVPPAGAASTIAAASRRVQSVSERLRTFLQQKLKQFEAISQQCEAVIEQRGALTRLKEEVLRDKGEWEQRRQEQMDELRAEQERLISAWQKLEDEQRLLIAQQESIQLQSQSDGSSDSGLFSFPSSGQSPEPAAVNPDAGTGSVFAQQTVQPRSVSVGISRDSALDQFQQLKHEIRKHINRLQEQSCESGMGNH